MSRVLQLSFLPRSVDFALLLLRAWVGLNLLIGHGWAKLTNFSATAAQLPDPLGIGHQPTAALAVLAEVVAAALLVLGLWTRLAALIIAIELGVAFVLVHHLTMAGYGEVAYLDLGAALTLLIAGGGRFGVAGGTSS